MPEQPKTYNELLEEFKEKVRGLQKLCKHEKSRWREVGITDEKVCICEFCHKILGYDYLDLLISKTKMEIK